MLVSRCGVAGRKSGSGFDERHETREGLDTAEEGIARGVARKVHMALARARNIAVERHIGDRRRLADQPVALRQLALENLQQRVGPADNFLGVMRRTENGNETCGSRTVGDFAGSDRKPALDRSGLLQIFGKPIVPSKLLREIDENGVGIWDDGAAVSRTGTWPNGLSAMKAGSLWAPASRSTSISSCGSSSSDRNS